MADFANVNFILRNPKNKIINSTDEKVLLEVDTGSGVLFRRCSISQTLVLGGAGFQSFTTTIPIGARILAINYYLVTAVVLTTAVKLGFGIAGTPIAFALSGVTMTIGSKETIAATVATANLIAAAQPRITTTDVAGAAVGSGTGTVKATIVYEYLQNQTATS